MAANINNECSIISGTYRYGLVLLQLS